MTEVQTGDAFQRMRKGRNLQRLMRASPLMKQSVLYHSHFSKAPHIPSLLGRKGKLLVKKLPKK